MNTRSDLEEESSDALCIPALLTDFTPWNKRMWKSSSTTSHPTFFMECF